MVAERTSAWHYITWTAKLFTYTAQVNPFQIFAIGGADTDYSILAPVLDPASIGFTPTCQLYADDMTTLATTQHSTWLSFNAATLEITALNAATNSDVGEYDLNLKCTLDDDDNSVEWTPIKYYLINVSAATQDPIWYLLGSAVKSEPIDPFSYSPNSIPFDANGAIWTYSVNYQSGTPTLVSTVSSSSDDILVGEVASDNAGVTTGLITDTNKVGSSVYTLTGQLSGTDL